MNLNSLFLFRDFSANTIYFSRCTHDLHPQYRSVPCKTTVATRDTVDRYALDEIFTINILINRMLFAPRTVAHATDCESEKLFIKLERISIDDGSSKTITIVFSPFPYTCVDKYIYN